MELVYLWVEDYKNIKKQGFNFSPRFECKFHYEYEKYITDELEEKERLKENRELEIKDREHIEDFFGENINVTAIVGENGSGKSTLIDILYNNPNLNKIVVYYNKVNNSFYYSNSNIKINIEANNLIELDDKIFEKIHINFHDICNYKNFEVSILNNLDEELSLFNYNPYKLYFKIYNNKVLNLLEKYKDEIIKSIDEHKVNYVSKDDYADIYKGKITNKYSKEYKYKLFDDLKEKLINKTDNSFLLFLFFDYFKKLDTYGNTNDSDFDFIGEEFFYRPSYRDEEGLFPSLFDDNEIKKIFLSRLDDNEGSFFENFFNTYSKFEPTKIDNESISLFIEKILKLGVEDIFDFTIEDKNKVSNKMLSDGEKQSILLLLSISKELKELENDNIFIFLDEIELTYHPNWQKQVINTLIKFFKENYSHLKVHFIITTHSPFLLSDLPKENIIFLKDGKKDVGIKKQTFGANIHTLLSDSFFMDGGLMGDFAKQKINEIITNLKDKKYTYTEKEKTKVLLTIESIGEPFLKSKLLDMYNRRFIDDYKIREQKRIDEQIRILQEKREQLDD